MAEDGLRQSSRVAQETQAAEHSHSVAEGVEGRAESFVTVHTFQNDFVEPFFGIHVGLGISGERTLLTSKCLQ